MSEKEQIITDWDLEQNKIEEEYKRKMQEFKKKKKENELVDKILTRGILPILVLNIISKEPSNGNEISTKISGITQGAWQPSTGGIYPILKKFEKQGYVKGKWDDPVKRIKRIYTITETGRGELQGQKGALVSNLNKTLEVFDDILKSFDEQM